MVTVTRRRATTAKAPARGRDWIVVGAFLVAAGAGLGLLYRQHLKVERQRERELEHRRWERHEKSMRGMTLEERKKYQQEVEASERYFEQRLGRN